MYIYSILLFCNIDIWIETKSTVLIINFKEMTTCVNEIDLIAYFLVTIHTNVEIKWNKRSATLHNAGQGCHSLPILTIMCYVVL